jgi:hypothetical protein
VAAGQQALEGPVLVAISHGHGITLGDLLAPAGAAFAAVLLYRRSRSRRGTHGVPGQGGQLS